MNFGWIKEGVVAGCRGPRSEEDLDFLLSYGIRGLVRLAFAEETGLTSRTIVAKGIQECYEPVQDFTAPSQDKIDCILQFMENAIAEKKPVAVSCGAGYGRTGTILACYLVYTGMSAPDAIEFLCSIRPCSEELLDVPSQRQAIFDLERRLRSL